MQRLKGGKRMETTSTTSAANEKEPMETTIFISDADQYVFG